MTDPAATENPSGTETTSFCADVQSPDSVALALAAPADLPDAEPGPVTDDQGGAQ